jgi:hypothetical protein
MTGATPAYLREQAERCRRLADDIADERAKRDLLKMAEEYEAQAADAERAEKP